ncbi:heavy-metal-associated domain-containing protein [Pseudobacter ginsenosidimutans]|uniref:Copper chaperone CopZ n=1 Tax=Pseudobacter ginsenosidimutans TaxID=661488 RepID=A0A4Q7MZZ6_9BACT|nr:heavy metal-associated domain-containing protein [Pseudobacter ginsenosidimutans]QEC43492.1 heavy-metal-associated domain-containing protein [Pseudobacter ginsenosidimutans]RZS74880.1 copper chaperone CopZ [Pseudobacter ginsenosidimutans]
MKKIFVLAVATLLGFAGMAQFKSASLQAAGLTCAMCTKAINTSLEQLPFVKDVDVDIKTSSFIINFKEGSNADFDQLKNAVEDAGFSVAKLSATGNFNNVKVENDTHVQIGGKNYHFLNIKPQTLDGEKTIVLADKDFMGSKEFKKISAATKMSCVQTGKAAACCTKDGISANSRIYHVTI